MDHMKMGHGDMGDMPGHGGHEGHTMPSHGEMCNMNVRTPPRNESRDPPKGLPKGDGGDRLTTEWPHQQMLFTWDTTNLCIVFNQWHIRTTAGLLFSLAAVVLIGMGYEALRAGTRRYEVVMNKRVESVPSE